MYKKRVYSSGQNKNLSLIDFLKSVPFTLSLVDFSIFTENECIIYFNNYMYTALFTL